MPPEKDGIEWEELTDEQKLAGLDLCYMPETWGTELNIEAWSTDTNETAVDEGGEGTIGPEDETTTMETATPTTITQEESGVESPMESGGADPEPSSETTTPGDTEGDESGASDETGPPVSPTDGNDGDTAATPGEDAPADDADTAASASAAVFCHTLHTVLLMELAIGSMLFALLL